MATTWEHSYGVTSDCGTDCRPNERRHTVTCAIAHGKNNPTDPLPPDGYYRRLAADTVAQMLRDECLEMDIPGIQVSSDQHGVIHVGVNRHRKFTNLGDYCPGDWVSGGDAVASDGSVWCDWCSNRNAADCPHKVPVAAWCAQMILGRIIGHLVDDIYTPPPA